MALADLESRLLQCEKGDDEISKIIQKEANLDNSPES
jgi:hypothetical protein